MAFDNPVLPERSLEREPETLGRSSGPGVRRITLPLNATIAKIVEYVREKEGNGLGGSNGFLKALREVKVPDLDHAIRRVDPHERGEAGRYIVGDHGVK